MTVSLVLGLLLQAPAPAETPGAETVREIRVAGTSVYEREDLLRILRQREGEALRTTPAALAARLESRYHLDGYLAASVSAAYDAGRLAVTVDEGELAEVAVHGVDGASARRAVQAAGLAPGHVLEQSQVWDALARIERASDGALKPEGDPPYTVERNADGASRLVLHVRKAPVSASLFPAGPRAAGRYNRVDGVSLGLLGELTLHDTSSYDDLRFWALGSWGFSSHKLRYALGGARPFFGQKLVLGYEYHDLTDTDDTWRKRGLEEATGGVFNTQKASDYFRRIGHHLFAFGHINPGLEVGAAFRWDGYTSLPVVTDDSLLGFKEPRPNPAIEEGRLRSLVLAAGWASRGALFPSAKAKKRSFMERNLYQLGVTKPEGVRVEATLELTRPGWGSDYDFTRFIGNVRTHHERGNHFVLDTRLLGGTTSGAPPSFKRFSVGGLGSLRGYQVKQFDGTDMALFTVEAAYVPGHRLPALISFYDGGRTWGEGASPARRWRDALGIGVRWPARGSAFFARFDAAWPLDQDPGQDRSAQLFVRISIPF